MRDMQIVQITSHHFEEYDTTWKNLHVEIEGLSMLKNFLTFSIHFYEVRLRESLV